MAGQRVDAVAFGDLTRAVVVGVSSYQDPGLRPLPACAPEAARLAEALVDVAGCRIPGGNVRRLIDGEATRDAVLSALETCSSTARPEELLIFYFAGHGQAIGDTFALLLAETRLDRLASTGIASSDLDRIFRSCKARGVLLILDCCGGAALAEHAPDFVRSVGPHEFRILLSASRADQSSWETPKGSLFTGHLLKVVEGRVQVSAIPGQVYFNDLLSHLRHSVGEEIANAGGQLPPQEPVFNGSYTEDPLVFLHTGETLKSVRVKVQRYSRAYVMQRVRLAVLGVSLMVVLSLSAYWLLLDQHYYLELSDRDVAVYHGYPGLSGFGYPKLWWRMEIERSQVKEDSPLQTGEKVVLPRRESALAMLDQQLTPAGKALWRLWENRQNEAGVIVRQALQSLSVDRPVDRSQLLQLFAETATAGDRGRLMELAAGPNSEVVQAAIRALARIDRPAALQALGGRGFEGQAGIHLSALQLWQKPCDAPLVDYLEMFQKAPGYSQYARATIDTAMRAGCVLSIDPLLGAPPAYQDLVAIYWALSEGGSPRPLAGDLSHEIGVTIENTIGNTISPNRPVEPFEVLERMVTMALGLPKAGCPLRWKSAVPKRASVIPLAHIGHFFSVLDEETGSTTSHASLRGRLAALAADSCPGIRVVLQQTAPSANAWEITLADEDDNQVTIFALTPSRSASNVDAVMLAEHVRTADQVENLKTLAHGNFDPYMRALLVRRLRMMGVPWIEDSSYFDGGDTQLQLEAYLWHATTDRRQALLSVLARLSDPTANFLPEILGLLVTTQEERDLVVARVRSAVSDQGRRTALMTMFGSPEVVVALLTSPEALVRATAVDYLDSRDDTKAIAAQVSSKLKMPTFFAGGLATNSAWYAMREEIEATPDWALPERAKMILDLNNTLSSGMRIWIDRDLKRRTEGFVTGGPSPDPAG